MVVGTGACSTCISASVDMKSVHVPSGRNGPSTYFGGNGLHFAASRRRRIGTHRFAALMTTITQLWVKRLEWSSTAKPIRYGTKSRAPCGVRWRRMAPEWLLLGLGNFLNHLS